MTGKWNHNHPPKEPSKFEVFKDNQLVYSGTYEAGMRLIIEEQSSLDQQELKKRMSDALDIIDEHVTCASTKIGRAHV